MNPTITPHNMTPQKANSCMQSSHDMPPFVAGVAYSSSRYRRNCEGAE